MDRKCGYSFWGYLGDVKFTRNGEVASTPDGNAFYSWCIIRELQKRGYEVTQIMPDRDDFGFKKRDDFLFASWLQQERVQAYFGTEKIPWYECIDFTRDTKYRDKAVIETKNIIMHSLHEWCNDLEFILHEYRMWIPGRNDYDSIFNDDWQPDYLMQECIFEYCTKKKKKLIIFDLDYKLDYKVYNDLKSRGCPVTIFELGTKWESIYEGDMRKEVDIRQVFIPFDFDNIDYYNVPAAKEKTTNLVYIGNRYERDWCIDKYIPSELSDCKIYGNWLEGGRDSKEKWSNLYFGQRLQTRDMRQVYSESVATILLAKKEYCEFGFMTARILEAIFYGTVPLFIEEYGDKTIKRYAGDYAGFLTVRSAADVCEKIKELRELSGGMWIRVIIEYMRDRLKFMDVKYFVDTIEEVAQHGI